MLRFKKITSKNFNDFSKIYKNLSANDIVSFRYYENRGLNYVLKIFNPELVYFQSKPIGYYHLDIENETCWFGVFIVSEYRNKGFSTKIIERSKFIAKSNNINKIHLTVDSENIKAINSYIKNGFIKTTEINQKFYMICNLI